MEKITEISKELYDSIPKYVEDSVNESKKLTDTNRALKGIEAAYKSLGLDVPEVIFGDSPMDCINLASKRKKVSKRQALNNSYTCIWWRRWTYYYMFTTLLGVVFDGTSLEDICNLVDEVDCIIAYDDVVFLSKKPIEIHWNEDKLHNLSGKSVKYADGYGIYSVEGHLVPAIVVENPDQISVDMIQSETNQEVRRIMVNAYGTDKYLNDINAKIIDVDMRGILGSGPRALLEEPANGNQWLVATDGSTDRVYHLFVGKGNKSCRQAHELLCGFNEDLIVAEA